MHWSLAVLVSSSTKDFVKLRNCIARQGAYAYNEHFNASVNMAKGGGDSVAA